MTTDRTAAPTRGTALADRAASAAGRIPAPPTDMFSALLGAATPRSDAPARREDSSSSRRDDHQRADKPRRPDDSLRAQQRDELTRPATPKASDAPAADAAEAATDAPTDPAAEEKPTAPTAPNIFALQLASPLPPQTPVAPPAAAEAPLPVLSGQIPASVAAATTAQTAAAAATTGAIAASAAADAEAAAATAAAATTAQATATPGAIELAGLPAEATADATVPANIDLTKPQTPATDAQAAPAQDAATSPSLQQQTSPDAQAQDQGNAPAQPNTAAVPQAKPADALAPAPAQPANTSPIAPTAAPAMPSTPHVERAVPLSRAIATTGVLVHMMENKGVNHARLNLKPAELGGIEVRLRSTGDGVHALLVADSPEAARMLASAGDDLKRQLEDKNVNLLSLDVSTSDQRQEHAAGFNADGFGDDYRPGASSMSRRGGDESALLMDAPANADTVLVLPDGVHVDVLA